MSILIIFNRPPYDGSDVTWNGLRLAATPAKLSHEVRLFLMNDAVDLARDACQPPATYDQNLGQRLKDLIAQGVAVRVCGTCMARCGVFRNEPYFDGAAKATMQELADWVADSEKVVTF
jgi:uncharacterized protein involved in oxidation of intracellular sulfur